MELLLHSRLQDRVIEKLIRPLRSGRFVAARYSLLPYGLFFHLLFVNLAQTGPIARSPASTDDDGPETPATS